MESFIRHSGPDPEYYNCSLHNESYWYSTGQKRQIFAIYFFISATILVAIYLLSLITIVKARLIQLSCYKIMFTMGFFDISSIIVNSFITGYLSWNGAVFCTNPTLIYISGSIGVGLWSGSCCLCILLALNRFSELTQAPFLVAMFKGSHTYFLLCVPFLYCFCITFFTPPGMFTSKYLAWYFDPMNESGLVYFNYPHTVNNFVVAILASIAYGKICYKMSQKTSVSKEALGKVQRQLFIQSTIICSVHAIASYGYLLMNYIPNFPVEIVQIGHVAWQWSNGSPGVVYLLLNRQIQRNAFKMIGMTEYAVRSGSVGIRSTGGPTIAPGVDSTTQKPI